jgi:dTDP-4-dehydrorhamnose reductase
MKILLLGAKGQIGWELQRSLSPFSQLKICDRTTVDFEDTRQLQLVVRQFAPTVIVNAAAYTAVDLAESEVDKAFSINAKAVDILAIEARSLGAWLIHYSTDYVFDGKKSEAYVETDTPNPQSVYGRSKLQGEEAIRVSGCSHLIFRTSWVYATRGANFAKTMMHLAKDRDELKVVADQFGAPTSAELIADVTALCLFGLNSGSILHEDFSGIYNLVAAGETSWYGFAKYVVSAAQKNGEVFRVSPDKIQAITTEQYPMLAERPANSRLESKKLEKRFKLLMPSWQTHVDRMIAEIVN